MQSLSTCNKVGLISKEIEPLQGVVSGRNFTVRHPHLVFKSRSAMQVYFTFLYLQVVWKGAHLLGCGKTFINGEPYYIAQMDTPGVIAGVPGYDKSNVGEPKEVRCSLFNLREEGGALGTQ